MDRISLVFGWREKVGIGLGGGGKKGKKNHSFRVATDGRNRTSPPLHPFPPTVISSDQPSGERVFLVV